MLIKSQLGEDKRRFRLKEVTFPCLCYNISALYSLSNEIQYTLYYFDEDDWITLSSTDDLKEALLVSPKLIKILVKQSNPNSNNSINKKHCDNCANNQNNNNNSSNNNSNRGQPKNNNNNNNARVENIAMELLMNDALMFQVNNIVSNSLTNYLPHIITSTIPYTIPLLVSSISAMKSNEIKDQINNNNQNNNNNNVNNNNNNNTDTNSNQLKQELMYKPFLQPPLTLKEKRFSCSAEEKYLIQPNGAEAINNESINSSNSNNNQDNLNLIIKEKTNGMKAVESKDKSNSFIGMSLNNLGPQNNMSSLTQSLPAFMLPPPPSADEEILSNYTNSTLKESKDEVQQPKRKSSSPLPFFNSFRSQSTTPMEQMATENTFRPISPISQEMVEIHSPTKEKELKDSQTQKKRSFKTFFSFLGKPDNASIANQSTTPPIQSNNNNSNNNSSTSSNSSISSDDDENLTLNLSSTTIEQLS